MTRIPLRCFRPAHHKAETNQEQRGIALIIALLMTATLSFLALGISQSLRTSIDRSITAANRMDLNWRVVSANALARSAINRLDQLTNSDNGAALLLPTSPLFLAPVQFPLTEGSASLQLADAGRCFNINSLIGGNAEQGSSSNDNVPTSGSLATEPTGPKQEFISLAVSLGLSQGVANDLVAAIVDWTDADATTSIGGAEDDFYTSLPSPFRTAGGPIADVSELRALIGFDQITFEGLRPFLCAYEGSGPMVLNINMLRPIDAPLLGAIISSTIDTQVDPSDLLPVINRRPAEGWPDIRTFWSEPELANFEVPETVQIDRTSVSSDFLRARAITKKGDTELVVNFTYGKADSGSYRLVAKSFGLEP
ncbi:MAG: type II secretion system minor pseudopilin GspK [Pseudomonadota bacterium]